MMKISTLVAKKDGAALKALALESDHNAGLAFANLVFEAQYAGDTSAGGTKKDAKNLARSDAFAFVEKAAETQFFDGMVQWADLNLMGVREPGQFGSRLRGAFYGEAETWYQRILEHLDCPDDRRGEFLIRKAQSIEFKSRVKGLEYREEVMGLLNQALDTTDAPPLANFLLAGMYLKQGLIAEAAQHTKQCCESFPYALLTIQQTYKQGLGVQQDTDKASELYEQWFERARPKSRAKAG